MSLLTRVRDVLDRLATAEMHPVIEEAIIALEGAGEKATDKAADALRAPYLIARDDVVGPGDLAILLLDLDDAIRAEDNETRADVPDDLWGRALPTTPPPDAP